LKDLAANKKAETVFQRRAAVEERRAILRKTWYRLLFLGFSLDLLYGV
jgi:hypothetical protein